MNLGNAACYQHVSPQNVTFKIRCLCAEFMVIVEEYENRGQQPVRGHAGGFAAGAGGFTAGPTVHVFGDAGTDMLDWEPNVAIRLFPQLQRERRERPLGADTSPDVFMNSEAGSSQGNTLEGLFNVGSARPTLRVNGGKEKEGFVEKQAKAREDKAKAM